MSDEDISLSQFLPTKDANSEHLAKETTSSAERKSEEHFINQKEEETDLFNLSFSAHEYTCIIL